MIEARALQIKIQRVHKRAHEIACKYVIAELGRGMNNIKQ